jgi:hypothetical protein
MTTEGHKGKGSVKIRGNLQQFMPKCLGKVQIRFYQIYPGSSVTFLERPPSIPLETCTKESDCRNDANIICDAPSPEDDFEDLLATQCHFWAKEELRKDWKQYGAATMSLGPCWLKFHH